MVVVGFCPILPPSTTNLTTREQIRGKAIALHSQAITEFCYFVGAQVGKTRHVCLAICISSSFSRSIDWSKGSGGVRGGWMDRSDPRPPS